MPKPVYALIGDDPYLQLQSLDSICKEIGQDVQRVNVEGESADVAEVLDELRSFAMFGASKLVIVRNADDFISRFREPLENYLQNPSTSATLVLRVASLPATQRVYKLITKAGKIIKCEPPADLRRWIVDHAKSIHKLSLEQDAVRLLIDLIGADLGRLDNELAKLALQVPSGLVTVADISSSVAFQREQEIKEMTLELATGRPQAALRRWRQLVQLDSSAEFRAITWLTMWLEDVGYILDGGAPGKVSWKYRDKLGQFIQTAKAIDRKNYSHAVNKLAELDRRSKSGLGEASSNVELFILSLTK